ncbi:APC family permease [Microbacterium sp. NPDC064584]|uniref:APC family permease n=1 Tax=Microbacterium sp. NPDC064584 TaxID=3155817 RepID=UPI003446F595
MSPHTDTGDHAPLDTATLTTHGASLSRSLGLGGNVLITLSGISPASSVFILGGAALAVYGTGVFWGFLLAGVISILVGFCYAELGSRHPIAGGDYTLVSRVLGPAAGSAVFFISLVSLPLIIAIFALGVADYLGVAIAGLDPLWTALIVIVLTTITACFNIRTNAWVTGVFLFIEMAALALLALLGFIHVERPITALLQPNSSTPRPAASRRWGSPGSCWPSRRGSSRTTATAGRSTSPKRPGTPVARSPVRCCGAR